MNLMDRNGQTPLHLACTDKDVECARAIFDVTAAGRVRPKLDLKNFQGLYYTSWIRFTRV